MLTPKIIVAVEVEAVGPTTKPEVRMKSTGLFGDTTPEAYMFTNAGSLTDPPLETNLKAIVI